MEQFPKVRGKNQTQRNASIEHALQSLARRATKHAAVYISPVPFVIQCYLVRDDFVIGKTLVPFSGIMRNLYIRIGEMITKKLTITVKVISDVAATNMDFVISKKFQKLDVEMEIDAGSVIEVILEDGNFVDMIIGTAVYPKLEEHKAKKYLLEDIFNQEKE